MNRKFHKIKLFFLDLPKTEKLIFSILIDCFLCISTVWISFYLRIGYFPLGKVLVLPSIASIVFAIPLYFI